MRTLLRAALLAYPREFRREYGEQILADAEVRASEGSSIAELLGILATGARMRCEDVARDLAFAARRLRKRPLLVATIALTFALGIGANVAVFSVLDAALLKPLPFPNAGRIVVIASKTPGDLVADQLSIADANDIRSQDTLLERTVVYNGNNVTLTGLGKPVSLYSLETTWPYFEALGIRPLLGRFFNAGDARSGAHSTVISEKLWRKHFGSDPAIVGRRVILDGIAYSVVGVSPVDLTPNGMGGVQLWTTISERAVDAQRGARYLSAFALIKPGAAIPAVRAEIQLIGARLARRFVEDRNISFDAKSLRDALIAPSEVRFLYLAFAAALGVLLIACANVASLLLSDASTRGREFAMRSALGAGRGRIAGQMLVETALLAAFGGAIGLALARGSLPLLTHTVFAGLPNAGETSIDASALLYAFAIVAGATFAAGSWPVFSLGRVDGTRALGNAGRGGDSAGRHVRSALVLVEIALALAMITAFGLLARSVWTLSHQDLGIRPQGVVASRLFNIPQRRYPTRAAQLGFAKRLLEGLRAIPGARDAAVATGYPLAHMFMEFSFEIPGRGSRSATLPQAQTDFVSAGYFSTLGISVRQGRAFVEHDDDGAPVAVVNASFARRYWIGSPVGKTMLLPRMGAPGMAAYTIIGVVADERDWLQRPAQPILYVPISGGSIGIVSAIVRGDVASATLEKEVAGAFASADRLSEPPEVLSVTQLVGEDAAEQRNTAALFGTLAAIALLLALSGVYGVVSFNVARRTPEFGIRLALGASASDILLDVLRSALGIAFAGAAFGVVLAALAARALADRLYEVSPFDPAAFAGGLALLAGCTLAAAFFPAARAAKVDPVVALRYE